MGEINSPCPSKHLPPAVLGLEVEPDASVPFHVNMSMDVFYVNPFLEIASLTS